EAWAYIPPDGLGDIARLYSNNGQPEDPTKHIYGIASSPKVNDVCTGACAAASDWHTMLVSGEGKGGNVYFALDISGQPTANPPFTVLWHTGNMMPYTQTVGESWSVPAFAFVDSGGNPAALLLFGSGYDTTNDGADQGNYLQIVNAFSGSPFLAPIHLSPPGGLYTTYSVIADSVVARDPNTFRAIAA